METLQRTANRGSISTGYDIDNSVKLEADNVEFMDRTISTTGNRKTWTYSGWIKRTEISFAGDGFGHTFFMGGAYGSEACLFRFNTGTTAATLDTLQIDIGDGGTQNRSHTSQVFRDTSAWYHIVLAVDTTQSTATDRFKLYVNGELVTSYYSRNNPTQNFDTSNNYQSSGYVNNVGAYKSGGTIYGKFSGYIAESYNIDGSALEPTAFGEFDEDSGIWKPKKYTGSFPNNSWYLKFDDSGALGADSSGNSYTFTLNNITSADQATDTPTNNFATINTLPLYNQGTFSFPNGATEIKRSDGGGDGWTCVFSTMAVNKGKWYAEMEVLESPSYTMYGYTTVAYLQSLNFPQFYLGTTAASAGYYSNGDGTNDSIYEGDAYPSAGVQSSAGTIIGIAIDCDNNKIHFSNNGTYTNSSNPATNTNGFAIPDDYVYFAQSSLTGAKTYKTNLGGYTTDSISSAASDANGYGTFEYAPPTGFYALCTKNLAEFG